MKFRTVLKNKTKAKKHSVIKETKTILDIKRLLGRQLCTEMKQAKKASYPESPSHYLVSLLGRTKENDRKEKTTLITGSNSYWRKLDCVAFPREQNWSLI